MSNLFVEVKDSAEKVQLITRILSGSNLVTCSDIDQVIGEVFQLFKSKNLSDRVLFWRVVPLVIESDLFEPSIDSICNVVDALPLYVKHKKEVAELDACGSGLVSVFRREFDNVNLSTKIESIFSKLLSSVLKLAKSGTNAHESLFGLKCLIMLYQNRGRSMQTSSPSISTLCLDIIFLRSVVSFTCNSAAIEERWLIASELLAITASCSSGEQYDRIWRTIGDGQIET